MTGPRNGAKSARTNGRAISLNGRVAVVTGAGGGLGRAHALELARRGARVVVNDISAGESTAGPGADGVVKEIAGLGGTAVSACFTVGTPEGGRAIVDTALTTFGTVDIVVHNAGAWSDTPYADMAPDRLDHVLDVHLRGAFFVTQPAWSVMAEKGYGRLVLTSSGSGTFGRINGANYVAAKMGIFGLCRALALEGEPLGIKANAVMPIASTQHNPQENPISERKQPERVSPLVAYLASDACTVTGEGFHAGMGGNIARIFVGVTHGYWHGEELVTAEEIADHLHVIEDRSTYLVPASMAEFKRSISAALVSGK